MYSKYDIPYSKRVYNLEMMVSVCKGNILPIHESLVFKRNILPIHESLVFKRNILPIHDYKNGSQTKNVHENCTCESCGKVFLRTIDFNKHLGPSGVCQTGKDMFSLFSCPKLTPCVPPEKHQKNIDV